MLQAGGGTAAAERGSDPLRGTFGRQGGDLRIGLRRCRLGLGDCRLLRLNRLVELRAFVLTGLQRRLAENSRFIIDSLTFNPEFC